MILLKLMLKFLIKPLSSLPLPKIHRLGSWLGLLMYFLMRNSREIIKENLKQSNLIKNNEDLQKTVKKNMQENGKAILESLAIWQKDNSEILQWIKVCTNWSSIEKSITQKKGLIFLTPHMGCFEITSIFYGSHYPITVLFRQPKIKWLSSIIMRGRTHSQVKLAPANTEGVRKLLEALKRGEAIGILPDQIPGKGEGEWAPFFEKQAYTMTLVSKLAQKTGAAVIMAFGERLPNGEGFHIHLTALANGAIATPALLNKAIETQIAQQPTQYLWSYPRYKIRGRLLKKQSLKHD